MALDGQRGAVCPNQKLIGMLYRNELAAGLGRLGYRHGEDPRRRPLRDRRGLPREAIEAFSTRRAEIEAAMEANAALGATADSPRLAERAALMTRAAKRDIDRDELARRLATARPPISASMRSALVVAVPSNYPPLPGT